MIKAFKYTFFLILIFLMVFVLIFNFSPNFKKTVQLKLVNQIDDIASNRISRNPNANGSVAAEFINIPIEVRKIAPDIMQITGVGNTHVIKTSEGDVMFDTGLSIQAAKQMSALSKVYPEVNISDIILSHSHADHTGGFKFWFEDGMNIITHVEFEEEQRYLKELETYLWNRNRTLFPWMPETPPKLDLLSTGGVKPTLLVENNAPYKFTKGGMDFEVYALPGAEGSDNLVLWLPQRRILFSGDFFGPLFPQFPNIFTMRGEKIRKPFEYIKSLQKIIDLDPVIIIPSHKGPIDNKFFIDEGLRKILGATQHVHNETIKGMNNGKTVEELMRKVKLPTELNISQEHGKVSWAVKSIWEYYSTWFHFDRTTELYAVPQSDVYTDLLGIIDTVEMQKLIQIYIERGEFLKALHLIEIVLFDNDYQGPVLDFENIVLKELLKQANNTTKNSYEIYWLNHKLTNNQVRLEAQ